MAAKDCESYLVDLPVGSISNQFNQLKDTSRVLRGDRQTDRVSQEDMNWTELDTRWISDVVCLEFDLHTHTHTLEG